MARTRLLVVALGLALAAGSVEATSYVMVSDSELVDQAALVVEATVMAIDSPPGDRPVTDYRLRVDRFLKGHAASELTLRVPGGRSADGRELLIFGAPRLAEGEKAILFLSPGSEGVWRSLHLMLGTFHEVRVAGRRLAARNLVGTVEVGADGQLREGAEAQGRDFEAFAEWIARRAAGWPVPEDYLVELPGEERREVSQKFTHIAPGGVPTRWFEFDDGRPVVWHAESAGQPGMDDGGFAEVQQALAAWTHEPATSVHLAYGGTVAGGGGFSFFDHRNVVHFADPHEDIESPYTCGSGGVLAVGGPWFSHGLRRTFQGRVYIPILEADIITNRGLECFLLNDGPRLAEILNHEIGHTLGLGHSCGDDRSGPCTRGSIKDRASMRAQIHNDRRGASLQIDDAAAVRFLYAVGDGCGGGSARGGEVLCLHNGRFRLEVDWENQFNDTHGKGSALPSSDLAGFFYFTDPRNVELMVKMLDFGDRVLFFSGQLTNLLFAITVTDTLTGDVKVYTNGPADCGEIDEHAFDSLGGGVVAFAASVAGFESAETFTRAESSDLSLLQPRGSTSPVPGAPMLANRPGWVAPESASCRPGPHRLCLLEGRVAAELTWRNQFNETSGNGRAERLSDLTGSFSFDDPANLEVLLKALDFGDRILVLWGSLSNLEYSIEVTDTTSGAVNQYHNPAGTYCGGLDEAAF
jgi:hypothetical protein